MNRCGIQQKNTFASSCEEMRNAVSVSVSFDKGDHMVCPKPRRFSLFNTPMNEPVRPLRWHMCYQPEPYESKAGIELLEIIFEKGGGYSSSEKTCTQAASSPPFFSGSPPSRVSNPLIQDTRFGDKKVSPVSVHSMVPIPVPASGYLQVCNPNFFLQWLSPTPPPFSIVDHCCNSVDHDRRKPSSTKTPPPASTSLPRFFSGENKDPSSGEHSDPSSGEHNDPSPFLLQQRQPRLLLRRRQHRPPF